MAGSSESSGSSQSTSQSFIPDYSETPILEAIAQQAAGMSSQVYQWGMNQFNATQGNIDNMMRDALSYASPQRISTDMGMAESGVQQGVEAARQSAITDLQSFGIDPSSGRYAALDEANRVMGAASAAGAGNQQRMADIAAGNAMRNQAISASEQNNMFGLGVGNSANGFLSTAMNLKYPPLGTVSQSSSSQQSSSQSTNPPTQPNQPKQSSQPSDKGAGSGGGKGGGPRAGAGKGAAGMGAPPTAPGKVGSGLPGNQIPADVAAGTSGDPSTDPNSPFFDPYSARDPTGVITGLPADVNTPNGPVAQWGLDPQTGYPLGNDINPGNQPFTGWPTVPGYGNGQPDLPSGAPQPPVAGWPGGGTAQAPASSQDQGQPNQDQQPAFIQPPDTSQAQGQPDPSQLPSMDPGALQDAGQPAPYTGLDQPAGTQTSGQGQGPPVDQTQNQYDPYAMDPTAGMIDSTGTPLDANGNQIIGQNDQGDGSGLSEAGSLFGTDASGNWTVPVSDTGTAADTTAGFWSDIGQGAPDQPTTDFTLPPDAQGGITDPNSIWDQAAQDAGNFNTGFGGGDYAGGQGGQYGSGNYGGNYIGQGGDYSGGSNYAGGSNYSGQYGGNYIGQGGDYSGGSNYAGGSNYSGQYGGNYIGQGGDYSGGSNYAGGSNYSGQYGGNYIGQGGDYSGGSNYAGGSNYSGQYGGNDSSGGGGGSNYSGGGNYTGSYTGSDNTPTTDNTFDPSASDSGGGGGDGGDFARGGPVRKRGRRNMPMRTGFRPMPMLQRGGPMPPPGQRDPPPTPPPGVRPRQPRPMGRPGGLMPGNFISANGMTPPSSGGMPIGRPTRPPPGIQQPRRPRPPPMRGFAGGGQVADPTTGGFVSRDLSPSNGSKTDDVNAKLNAGEFVIPKDVAAWEGKKFFYNLIAKARKMRAAGQKPEQAKVGYAAGGPFKPPQMPGMGGMSGGNQPPPMQGAIGQPAPMQPRPQSPIANQVGRPSPLPNFQTMRQQSSRPQ